jgi:hypothetical protein
MRRAGGVIAAVVRGAMVDRLAETRAGTPLRHHSPSTSGRLRPRRSRRTSSVPSERLPDKIVERLAEEGVRCGTIDARTVRFVTHKDVDDADLDRAIAALDTVASTP